MIGFVVILSGAVAFVVILSGAVALRAIRAVEGPPPAEANAILMLAFIDAPILIAIVAVAAMFVALIAAIVVLASRAKRS